MGALVYLWLFLGVSGSFDVHLGWLGDHWFAAIVIVVGGALLVAITVRLLWRRFSHPPGVIRDRARSRALRGL